MNKQLRNISTFILGFLGLMYWFIGSDVFLEKFMPHIVCLKSEPKLVFLFVTSDLIMFLGYIIMTFLLLSAFRYVTERFMPFRGFLTYFGVFIFLCGLTHLFGFIDVYFGRYWEHAIINTMSAIAIVFVVFKLAPAVNSLKGMRTEAEYKELQEKYEKLESRLNILERNKP